MKLITQIIYWFKEISRFCPRIRRRKAIEKPFLIIGHRGSPASEVENTLPSFEKALLENANALEMDICLTKDNVPIIYHDWDPGSFISILRQNGFEPHVKYKPIKPDVQFQKPINHLTLAEVREGLHFEEKNNDNDSAVLAVIPTLEEFLSWSADKSNLKYIFLDIKIPKEDAELVLILMENVHELKQKYNPKFQIVYETAVPEVLAVMQKYYYGENYLLDIELPLGIILNPKKHSAVSEAIQKNINFALMMRPRQLTVGSWASYRRVIKNEIKIITKLLKAKSLSSDLRYLVCATISQKSEMKCLIKMGINAIMTDYPALLRQTAEKYKREIA